MVLSLPNYMIFNPIIFDLKRDISCVLIHLPPNLDVPLTMQRLARWLSGKESACHCRRHGFNPWVGKIPWRRKWQSTPVLLPGKSHRQRSLVGYSPWARTESDMTERLHFLKFPASGFQQPANMNTTAYSREHSVSVHPH